MSNVKESKSLRFSWRSMWVVECNNTQTFMRRDNTTFFQWSDGRLCPNIYEEKGFFFFFFSYGYEPPD